MKSFLTIVFTLSLLVFSLNVTAEDAKPLPNEDGYCGLCVPDSFVGSMCECTIDGWKEAGYTEGRCVRNIYDASGPWLCQVELPSKK